MKTKKTLRQIAKYFNKVPLSSLDNEKKSFFSNNRNSRNTNK